MTGARVRAANRSVPRTTPSGSLPNRKSAKGSGPNRDHDSGPLRSKRIPRPRTKGGPVGISISVAAVTMPRSDDGGTEHIRVDGLKADRRAGRD